MHKLLSLCILSFVIFDRLVSEEVCVCARVWLCVCGGGCFIVGENIFAHQLLSRNNYLDLFPPPPSLLPSQWGIQVIRFSSKDGICYSVKGLKLVSHDFFLLTE